MTKVTGGRWRLLAARGGGVAGLLAAGLLALSAKAQDGGKKAGPPAPVAEKSVEAAAPTTQPNLMPNSGFEEADGAGEGPKHWQKLDNLVYSWTTDPAAPERGKVLKIDTDVPQKQAYDWWVARYLRGEPLSKAPPKLPTSPPKYDTIAGLDGGFCWSDYIPIKPGRAYKIYVDAKGPGSKVFMRGYTKELPLSFADESPAVQEVFRRAKGEPEQDKNGRPIRYRPRYLYSTWLPVGGGAAWKTYTHDMPRNPTGRELTEDVRFVRIMLYPYWPPGEYWYDNVRVVEVDPVKENTKREADPADVEEGKVIR